jgi:hypothetical protein
MPLFHRPRDSGNQPGIAGKIRRALRKVDGMVLSGKLTDHGKNGRADIRQFGARSQRGTETHS